MSKKETLENFKNFLSNDKDSKWRDEVDFRQANKTWLKKSAKIAIKINIALREKKMTQKSLASKLSVSAQQISKILKGRENLTLETITKIESALGVELIPILKHDEIVIKKNISVEDFIQDTIHNFIYKKEEIAKPVEHDYVPLVNVIQYQEKLDHKYYLAESGKPKSGESNYAKAA